MDSFAIVVEGLGKRYRLGERLPYKTIRETVAGVVPRLAGGVVRKAKRGQEPSTIWALKDVSFTVREGEVVGIIGRNGAGKSTLLKVLSRVTEPTEGYAKVRGRVGSLLEVGTGFHPELTGRENIYLNGAILGMKRAEIKRKFDEIVAFAEIEEFLDTPVKRYSSGMYVRLAFAVAAHLEPEILLVDEVLAVGDAAFQKKCLGKMGGIAQEGRTVLFVSHNMAAVLSLCQEAYLLDRGRVVFRGGSEQAVERYMESAVRAATTPLHERGDRSGDGRVRLTSISVSNGSRNGTIRCSDRLTITIGYSARRPVSKAQFLVGIYDQFNRPIFFLDSEAAGGLPETLPPSGFVSCLTGPLNIAPGPCIVNLAVLLGGAMADHIGHVCAFDVEPDDFYGTGKITSRQTALCLIAQDWSMGAESSANHPS